MTVRLRLTLLYGALFLLAGAILIAITYFLYRDRLDADPLRGRREITIAFEGRNVGDKDGKRLVDFLSKDGRTVLHFIDEFYDDVLADALREQLEQSIVALGLTSAAALLLGWFVAGRVLRPIQRIAETARASSESNLHHRVNLRGPRDEMKELADTLDSLLERLERAFAGQRAFAANVSHELRTPLAILRAEAELRLAGGDADEADRAFARRVLEAAEGGERTVAGLLALARSESGLLSRTEVDLAELTGDMAGELAASTGRLEFALDLRDAAVRGDRALLERLAANLIDNAIRHNVPGGWVRVETEATAETAILRVANSGPRLSDADAQALFEPFTRQPAAMADDPGGHGLGLSIADAIVRAHGGTISAKARAEGGLEVEARLPRQPA